MSVKQQLLWAGLMAWLCVLWFALVQLKSQPVCLALVAWAASPLLLLFLRAYVEQSKNPLDLFDPKRQSWAFLFGDALWLPMAFYAVSYGQRFVSENSWFHSAVWLIACILIGILAGIGFHKIDQPGYVTNGYGQALVSPTKLAHDFVAYPLLFGGLLYLGVPVLAHHFWWAGAVAVLGVVLWFVMGLKDMLDPPEHADLHPKWDERRFTVNHL